MGIPHEVTITVLAVGAVAALVGMWLGWRSRASRSGAAVPELPTAPADLGEARTAEIPAAYVATTLHAQWLERVSAHGLGVRGRATVRVHDGGVVVARQGATDLVVPAALVRGVVRSSGMVGKFVADASIVVLTWEATASDGTVSLVDTGVRPDHAADRDALERALRALAPTSDSATGTPTDTPTDLPTPDATPGAAPAPKELS